MNSFYSILKHIGDLKYTIIATMATTPVLGKRKRAKVSYAEPEMTDWDEDLEEHVLLSDEDEMTDDDTTYGSRKVMLLALLT